MNPQTQLLTFLQRLTQQLDPGLSTSTNQQSKQLQQQQNQEVSLIPLDDDQMAVKKQIVTSDELLKVKKRNANSTEAQIYTHVYSRMV